MLLKEHRDPPVNPQALVSMWRTKNAVLLRSFSARDDTDYSKRTQGPQGLLPEMPRRPFDIKDWTGVGYMQVKCLLRQYYLSSFLKFNKWYQTTLLKIGWFTLHFKNKLLFFVFHMFKLSLLDLILCGEGNKISVGSWSILICQGRRADLDGYFAQKVMLLKKDWSRKLLVSWWKNIGALVRPQILFLCFLCWSGGHTQQCCKGKGILYALHWNKPRFSHMQGMCSTSEVLAQILLLI